VVEEARGGRGIFVGGRLGIGGVFVVVAGGEVEGIGRRGVRLCGGGGMPRARVKLEFVGLWS